ncbi:hypothetical protein DNH61_13075 [Paenibacillus sambharensis]|uniref:Uncharacterized protein n=1 Tax=Paenibacillus sambharensis TaxID=1803190 RepID=A0A2W1LUK3_9BACL|nr:hypothetical protein [Paenibacillus sambharensis]PZD95461.1 hypothetical protein DNH61_13075 [Paenibacillus sambharensis]
MMKVITFSKRSVPVFIPQEHKGSLDLLQTKLESLALDFDFRRKWKRIKSVQMIRDVAIFQYNDGTKLYLDVS